MPNRCAPSAAGSFAEICRILESLGPADLAIIEPHLKAWVRRAWRLLARDAAVRALAAYYVELGSGRAVAAALHRDLVRYAATGWRFEAARPPVSDDKRRRMHEILRLNRGKPIGPGQIRAILAGLR